MIRWEWAGPHAAVGQPLAAILSPRTGEKQLLQILEVLHAARAYTPEEVLAHTQPKAHNPYPAEWHRVRVEINGQVQHPQWTGMAMCGHNPYLVARRAWAWALGDGSGEIAWEDDPLPGAFR